MIPEPLLHIGLCVALLSAVACGGTAPTEPDSPTGFTGKWVGIKRLVSCEPAGPRCQSGQPLGEESYFSVTLNQQGDAVDGSVILSEPSPLALPYGFTIKGQVSPAAQLTFERIFFQDVGEPAYSGDLSIRTSLAQRLVGRMTKQPIPSDNITLGYELEAFRR
jgi:hypothetical protein